MSTSVITSPDQVTAGWLTAVLQQSGALTGGAVAGFDLDRGGANWSTSARLSLRYTAGSTGDLPESLFLKLVNADQEDEFFGPSEVTYYTRDYVDVPDAPLIRCYDAAFSQKALRYHLLLDDVSDSHVPARQKEPTLGYGLALAEALAILHARWWGAEGLAAAGVSIHSPDHIGRFVAMARPGAGHVLQALGGELEPHWPALIGDIFDRLPLALVDRTADADGFTLIHGDVGQSNVLMPREGDRPIYLIDRQPFDWSLTTWLGVYDLAYALVLDWPVATRRALERPVLAHYHRQLSDRGVRDYSWQRLYDDYRLAAAMGVLVAVEYCRGGFNERLAWRWRPMLERALTAGDDLNGRELW